MRYLAFFDLDGGVDVDVGVGVDGRGGHEGGEEGGEDKSDLHVDGDSGPRTGL